MKTKLNGILTLLLALVVQVSFAQSKTVSGTVTDSDGLPLPGVNIVVDGTTNGTQTDFDGNYSISASNGQVLVFTYIGQKEARVTVGAADTYNVQMEEDAQALEEVVVTAQGIKREKQALGYAVSSVPKIGTLRIDYDGEEYYIAQDREVLAVIEKEAPVGFEED